MSDHRQDVRLGHEAEQAKPTLDRAFDRVRDAMMTKLLAISPGNPSDVLTLHAAIQGIEAARQAVVQEIAGGQMAQGILDNASALAEQNQG